MRSKLTNSIICYLKKTSCKDQEEIATFLEVKYLRIQWEENLLPVQGRSRRKVLIVVFTRPIVPGPGSLLINLCLGFSKGGVGCFRLETMCP
jgi:hypothetical protein